MIAPEEGYRAARSGAALAQREDLVALRMHGRDPLKIIEGLVSNHVAAGSEGKGVYATLLTPKGKMVSDMRILPRPAGDILLVIPAAARDGVENHFRKFVPPLFARVEEAALRVLGLYGPGAGAAARDGLGAELPGEAEDEAVFALPFEGKEVLAIRTSYTPDGGYDMLIPEADAEPAWDSLLASGAEPLKDDVLETLRIEAGSPRWGAELDEKTIPLEAGLRERAISESKGCYTGQEVIIRILHRGHVNWHLRGFLLGDVRPPVPGTTLARPDAQKTVARITSACRSPQFEQTVALGYARRELDLPETLRLQGGDDQDAGPDAARDEEATLAGGEATATVVELPFPG